MNDPDPELYALANIMKSIESCKMHVHLELLGNLDSEDTLHRLDDELIQAEKDLRTLEFNRLKIIGKEK